MMVCQRSPTVRRPRIPSNYLSEYEEGGAIDGYAPFSVVSGAMLLIISPKLGDPGLRRPK